MPQVLQGSPNSPFYEHLRQGRAGSGSGARRDTSNSRSASLAQGQLREAFARGALPSQHFPYPASTANIYPLGSEAANETGKSGLALPNTQMHRNMEDLASPNREDAAAGGLYAQAGPYPTQF